MAVAWQEAGACRYRSRSRPPTRSDATSRQPPAGLMAGAPSAAAVLSASRGFASFLRAGEVGDVEVVVSGGCGARGTVAAPGVAGDDGLARARAVGGEVEVIAAGIEGGAVLVPLGVDGGAEVGGGAPGVAAGVGDPEVVPTQAAGAVGVEVEGCAVAGEFGGRVHRARC